MTDIATIDLSDAVPDPSSFLEIIHPVTKAKTGWKIELAGPQHENSVAVANDVGRDSIEEEFAIRAAHASGQKYDPPLETLQMRRRKNVNRVCRRILSWSPNPTFKSVQAEPVEFSVESATNLFLRPDMAGFFIQITQFLVSERSFMRPSETI
jgi:hypothetical protein